MDVDQHMFDYDLAPESYNRQLYHQQAIPQHTFQLFAGPHPGHNIGNGYSHFPSDFAASYSQLENEYTISGTGATHELQEGRALSFQAPLSISLRSLDLGTSDFPLAAVQQSSPLNSPYTLQGITHDQGSYS